jgi:anti-sigma factor RsiW
MLETLGCVNPGQVNDEDYLAYLNNNARPEFEAHLATCPYCRREVEAFRRADDAVHRNFGFIVSPERTFCKEAQKLGEYVIGLVSLVETREIEGHLASCAYCQNEVQELRAWLPDPEFVSISSPGQRLATTPAQREATLGWLRRVVATVLSVGQPQGGPVLAGALRGSLHGLPQVFQAEEVQITLSIQSAGPRRAELTIEGLVQSANHETAELEGAEVRLIKDAELLALEHIDDSGNFVFEEVPPTDKFDLEIMLIDKIVAVHDVSVN